EIDGVPAFWEDQLFGPDSAPVRFAIGDVVLEGINPCQRCIVPTRDALTGAATDRFQKTFAQQRVTTLPAWTHPSRFNHFYRLAVNTNIPNQGGKFLRVGDNVSLI
ncbi:MAG: MOSC domain-containing protein, partial [Cyanobacteria bacterium J06638_6]